MLACQSRVLGFKSRQGQKFGSRFLLHLCTLANSAMMSTLTAHCQWEDEMVRGRTGHPPSYAEAKKMKLLTLHTRDVPGTNFLPGTEYRVLRRFFTGSGYRVPG